MEHQKIIDTFETYHPYLSAKLSTPSYPNSSKYFDPYPIEQYDIEVFPYQNHGEEVEEKARSQKQGVEGKTRSPKTRSSRAEIPIQEDESHKPHD
jgi:hypothetical protein